MLIVTAATQVIGRYVKPEGMAISSGNHMASVSFTIGS
jgi:hypothetical protein